MANNALREFLLYGTNAERLAYTPDPPNNIQIIYIWYETDTDKTFIYDTAWHEVSGAGGTGDVTGPGSATDRAIALFNGTTGKVIQNSLLVVTTTGRITNVDEPISDSDAATKSYADSVGVDAITVAEGYADATFIPITAEVLTLVDHSDIYPNSRGLYAGTNIAFDDTTPGQRIINATAGATPVKGVFGVNVDGGGNVITTGIKGFIRIPVACTITKATVLATDGVITTGTIVVNVWKDTYANFPPTVADKITGTTPPTILSGVKSEDSTLTGWTTSVAAGDVVAFNVDSCTVFTKVIVELDVTT